jgi:hypothetical protein
VRKLVPFLVTGIFKVEASSSLEAVYQWVERAFAVMR